MKQTTFFWLLLLVAVLGILLYGPTVSLPLFLDDASNFRWLTPTNGLDVWITAGGFPFYRPLPFTLFKLLWHLQGGYHAPTLHALVVAIHLVNALLVGLLASRLLRRRAGNVAALLMLVFPFSYQAVALVGSIFHLILVTGTVGAALFGLHYLRARARWALLGAWIAAFCGTFSHENGVMIPALVGLIAVVALRGMNEAAAPHKEGASRSAPTSLWHTIAEHRRSLVLLLGPMVIIAAGYFALWLFVPKANDATGLLLADLDAKIAYFAQGLVYP
ncbi:MAG: hypothetical protein JW910_21225, partial [Anaerolineae bacterium]|nr:hypothetical protein [Anaerolineae bacterium]